MGPGNLLEVWILGLQPGPTKLEVGGPAVLHSKSLPDVSDTHSGLRTFAV